MARFFEKISFNQFKKDIVDNEELYNNYEIPKRATKNSAGYDFVVLEDFVLKPKEVKVIPTGIKVTMNEFEVLKLYVRSSIGFKYNIRLTNQVGIIDGDYYNNSKNEGHIWVSIQNMSDKDFIVEKGNKIVQGIFVKFLTTDDEKLIEKSRIGGIGSTN